MAKRKTFDEILQERYGSSADESTGVNDRSYDDIMLERRLSGKESDKWTSDMTKAFNQGNRYSKQAYEGAVEIAKNSRRVKTGAERYGLFSGGNEELNKGILHKASNYIKSKIDDGKSEITEEDSLKHASNVLAGVSEDNQALLKKYVDAQDSSKSTPFMYLMNTDSPVMQKQQMKDSETMDAVKKQFMENTGVDEKTFNKMVANYGYTYHADENEKQKKELQQSSGATKALASAVDVLASPVTGFVALAGTGKNQVDPELGRDNHTVYSSLKDFSENTEEAVLNDAEKIDNKALRTAAKGAYEVGMATGKSAMSMMTGSEAASALGLTGKSARAVANLVSLPQFGASSYVSTLEEAQERGLDTKNAYRTALVAGGAEMATEVISLEGIWDILESKGKVAAKTAIGNLLKQSFFEGSEEVANDLINEIADGLINGDKSKYVQSVRYYMSDQYAKENGLDAPLSEDEAKKKANIDFAKSTALDGALGAASGGLMGGAATAINAYANTKGGQYLSGNEQIRDDIVLNKDSENYISDDRADYDSEEDYQKAQSAIEQLIDDSGENISGKEARSLYQNVAEAIGSQNSNRAVARVQREVETIENAQTPDELVRATESVKNDVPKVQQAIDNTKARMVAQGATQADFDNVVTPTRAYEMAKRGQVSESDLASMSTDARRAAEAGISESVSADIKNVTKFDASTVLVKENGKAKQTNITGEVTKSGDQYYLTTQKGAKVELSEDILSGTTKANGDNTKGKLLMYGNSHAAGIISLEDPELMTIALQTKINQPSVPSTSIVKAVKTFNTLGRSGMSFESIVNDKKQKFMVDAIGEKVLRQAYDLGAKEGALDEEKMANPTTKKGSGKVSFASREAEGAYEKLDQANKTFLDKFAEKTGVDFELFKDDADAEGTVRGQYVPEEGKIRLNVAEDTDILEVAMHEGIGEFLKAHNAKGYAEITETILDYYAENNADALAKRIEDYKRAYSDEEGKSTRGSADELVNDVLAEIFADDAGIEKLGTWLFDNGKEKEAKTIKDVLIDFINQMKSWIADIKAQGGLSAAERSKLSMDEKDMDALQDRILKAMDEAIANRDSRTEGETAEQSIRNSVKVDANGKQYVEIDEDIIKGITDDKQIKEYVREYIKEYTPSLNMMGFELPISAKSRREFTDSKTTRYLQKELHGFFVDKMKMAANLEDIVNVGDGYTWEDIKHSRKDGIVGFVRGNVNIKVGNHTYGADIVLADRKGNDGLVFYDVINMKNKKIEVANQGLSSTTPSGLEHLSNATSDKTSISSYVENATRKSVKVDSDGRKLSEGQQEYFKDTKVVDDNGNLMVIYHGSPSKFNVFDAERIGTRASAEGYGFYFTDSREKAEGYHEKDGNLMKGYLDIQKPLSLDEVTIKRSEVKKLLENLDPTGDDILSSYDASGVGYPSRAWYNNAMRDALDMIMENENDADIIAEIANNYGSMDVVSEVRKVLGYDGYMAPDKYENGKVYVAFESNQFKNIDNENPTENADIRYSRKVEDARKSIKEYGIVSPYHDTLNEANVVSAIMGRMNEALDGVSVDLNGVMDVTKSIIKKYDANISTNDLAGAIWQTFNYMNNNQMETDYQGMMDYLLNIGDEVIATSQLKDADQQAVYDEVRKQLRTHAIHLTKADRAELVHRYGSWNEAFGAIQQAGIKLDNNGIRIDSAYGDIRNEIMKISGVQMSEETTAADQIVSIIDTVSSLEPEVSTFEGANDLDKSLMVASDIIDEYYTRAVKEMSNNIVEGTDAGKKAVKEAVDKQTEKLRKEMQQYKKTIGASYQDQVTRYKTELERTQKDLRAVQNNLKNWKPVPETQILNQAELDAKAEQMATKALTDYKMAQERSKQIDNIKRTGHRMIRWLDAPTDKQHVPEFLQRPLSEFLSSVDFLPLRAKETSKNTLDWRHQMMVLKDVITRLKESDPEIDSDGYALSQVLVVDELVEKMQNILDNNQDVNMKVSKLPAGDLKEMSEVLSSLSAAINPYEHDIC